MISAKGTIAVFIASFSATAAIAGIVVFAQDKDQAVAIQKANLLAQQGSLHRKGGTCVTGYSSSARCKQVESGNWECSADYAKYPSSCGGGRTMLDDVNKTIETIKKLCEGQEAACAAAAA
jgi:hypothetical protein